MDDITELASPHYVHSTLRERIVEHVFVGEALRKLWHRGVTDVEVLRSEFDAGGYDVVMALGKVVRHIQFKTITLGGRATSVNVSLRLMDKPSGCVIWIVITPKLDLQSFLWFGAAPGKPLPDIGDMKPAKHAKANVLGIKTERPNHRIIPRARFTKLDTLDDVLDKLFGPQKFATLVSPVQGAENATID
jgi:hypothetical protein